MQTQDEPKPVHRSDEVDLLQACINAMIFFRKHSRLLISAVIISILLAAGLFVHRKINSRTYCYTASMVCTTCLNTDELTEVISSLSNTIQIRDFTALARKLTLSSAQMERIRNLSISHLFSVRRLDAKGNPLGSSANRLLRITVKFYPLAVEDAREPYTFMDTIQRALNTYVNNNPYLRKKITHMAEANRALVREIDIQLSKLEQMQNLMLEQKARQGQIIIEANTGGLSSQVINLRQRKMSLDSVFLLIQPMILVEDYNISKTAEMKGVSNKKIVLYSVGIVLLALAYALCKDLNALVQRKQQTKNPV